MNGVRTDPKNIVHSIIKAARLLDTFNLQRREITLGEFAVETGMNKTTTHRLLQTLMSAGWVTRSPSGAYRLGSKLLYLGAVARSDLDIRNEALPLMRELAEAFGDTAFLMLPESEGAVVIETVVGTHPVRVHGVTVGSVLPYHVAAGPVAIAAFNPAVEERALAGARQALTGRTVTGAEELRAYYAKAREQGYALSVEDYVAEVSAVAAPVLDADGVAVGAISLGGPADRFAEPLLSEIVTRVRASAAELGKRMGAAAARRGASA